MKLISTHLLNFRLHADTFIDWPLGMTGIIGPNESGKSTITEGVRWAFFGSKALRKTTKGLRWVKAPARNMAQVVQVFEVGGQRYRIDRTERKAIVMQYTGSAPFHPIVEDAWKAIAEGTAAVDDYLPGLLGMDLAEFDATYMCGQKDIARLTTMKGTARKQFILKVLGVGRIDVALKACRERKNVLASEVDGMAAGLGDRPEDALKTANAERETAEAGHKAAAADSVLRASDHSKATSDLDDSLGLMKQVEDFQRVVQVNEAQVGILTEQITGRRDELDAAKEAADDVEAADKALVDLDASIERRDRLADAVSAHQDRQRVSGELDEVKQRLLNARQQMATLDESIAAFDSHALAAASSAHEEAEQAELNYRRDTEARRAKLHEVTAGIAVLEESGRDSPCPTCQRSLKDVFGMVMSDMTVQADALEADITARAGVAKPLQAAAEAAGKILQDHGAAKTEAERAQAVKDTLADSAKTLEDDRTRLSEHLARIPDTPIDLIGLEDLNQKVADLEGLKLEREGKAALAERIPDLEGEMKRLMSDRDALNVAVGNAQKAIAESAFDQVEHEALVAAESLGRNALAAADMATAAARATEAACTDAKERATRALSDWDFRKGQHAAKQIDLDNHTVAAERLADFRTAMAASIQPELEELTSGFVQALTDGRHEGVVLSDDFDVTLLESGIPTEVISGGTEDIAALAMRLAISQLVAERAGHPLSLLMLDEPFGSLDDVRRDNVLALLDRLKGTFEQVVVVTHVDAVKDSVDELLICEFDPIEQVAHLGVLEGVAT